MSKQKYQLPQQTIINTINEEAQSIISESLSQSDLCPDYPEKTELVPIMTESVISEETIIISDPLPVLRKSPNRLSSQSLNSSCIVTSESYSKSSDTSNSMLLNVSRQQSMSQIPIPCNNENSVFPLIPKENHKINEINYNGFSEFVEVSILNNK